MKKTPNTIEQVLTVSARGDGSGPFRAVLLKKTPGGYEIVKCTSEPDNSKNIKSFLSRILPDNDLDFEAQKPAIIFSMDSTGLLYYPMTLPVVDYNQAESFIKMQAQAELPLSLDQMYYAWRKAGLSTANQQDYSFAAAKIETYKNLFSLAEQCDIDSIIPDCEGIIKSWQLFFDSSREKTAVLNINDSTTQVLLVHDGILKEALRLSSGKNEFIDESKWNSEAELFTHDLRSVLERFSGNEKDQVKTVILPSQDDQWVKLIEYLKQAGIDTDPAKVQLQGSSGIRLTARGEELSEDKLVEYMDLIGCGICAMGSKEQVMDMYAVIRKETLRQQASLISMKVIGAAVLMIVAAAFAMVTWKYLDKKELAALQDSKLNTFIKQQNLRRSIALERPDVLDIIQKLTDCQQSGMLLDSFTFQKGKPVIISSSASNNAQLYEFEKKLKDQSGIKEVKIINPTYDEKKKRVSFKMTFKYKNF